MDQSRCLLLRRLGSLLGGVSHGACPCGAVGSSSCAASLAPSLTCSTTFRPPSVSCCVTGCAFFQQVGSRLLLLLRLRQRAGDEEPETERQRTERSIGDPSVRSSTMSGASLTASVALWAVSLKECAPYRRAHHPIAMSGPRR